MSEKGDKCQRCGEVGQDRRTIFSACMYEMQETGIPFDQVKIKGTFHEKTGMKDTAFGPVPAFSEEGSRTEHQFYTILVCKSCHMLCIFSTKATPIS